MFYVFALAELTSGNIYDIRRPINATIWDIGVVSNCISDIINIFATDYVVSRPTWEFFENKENVADTSWVDGLKKELFLDRLNGIIGKTCIHTKYGVATLLNWQNDEWANKFATLGIDTYFILRGKLRDLKAKVPVHISNEVVHLEFSRFVPPVLSISCKYSDFYKERIGGKPYNLQEFYENIYTQIVGLIDSSLPNSKDTVLVLGTEEFMFTPMVFGKMLCEKFFQGKKVYAIPMEITKGNALRFICENLIPNNQSIISAGDSNLDMSMLDYSNYSIIPSDSSLSALNIDGYIKIGEGIYTADAILKFVIDLFH